ncbi:MAG: DUF402 domain-containing protein [Chloroflexi bacterium]|nr:DUF402 domain-containing protein [Chloroflexota bacterium]
MHTRWQPGFHVVMRSMWKGRVRAAWPEFVVEDRSDALITYIPKGVTFRLERTAEGNPSRLPIGDRVLSHETWTKPTLVVAFPGREYRFLGFWDDQHERITRWYVNLETPFERTVHGYDFTDMFLDIVIMGDLADWKWKDEEELLEAKQHGLVSNEDIAGIRAAGMKAMEHLRDNLSSISARWESWRPDPAWPKPTLPANFS